jgi:hypothetical protein
MSHWGSAKSEKILEMPCCSSGVEVERTNAYVAWKQSCSRHFEDNIELENYLLAQVASVFNCDLSVTEQGS